MLDLVFIVLGGGLSKCEALYLELPAAIAPYLFKGVRVPPILPPKFGGHVEVTVDEAGKMDRHQPAGVLSLWIEGVDAL